jgi:hypothetical protein
MLGHALTGGMLSIERASRETRADRHGLRAPADLGLRPIRYSTANLSKQAARHARGCECAST